MNKRQIPGNNSVFSFLSLLFFLTFSGKGLAQTLTVSSATSSSTGWTFNAGTITVTANSTINSSDINSFLSNGSLTIVGNSSNFAVVINNAITSSVSGNGLTIGALNNAGNITLNSAVAVAGFINMYGGVISLNANLTSSATGNIFLKSISNANGCIVNASGATLTKSGGSGVLTMQGNARIINFGAINATGTGVLDVIIWSDFDNTNNDGGVSQFGSISTNGGHVWLGGSSTAGGSYTWNGLTVGNGPSIGSSGNNANALDLFGNVTTNGGDFLAWAGNGASGGGNGITNDGNGDVVNVGNGDIILISDVFDGSGTTTLNFRHTGGTFTLVPNDGSFPAAFNWNPTISSGGGFNFPAGDFNYLLIEDPTTLTSLTIGRYEGMLNGSTPVVLTNSSNVTMSTATSIAGPISIYGGALSINAALTATNNTINLHATGAVTQTAALSATSLGLHGTGTFTLNNTSNNVATIAAGESGTRLGSLSFTDVSGGLTIGTVGTKSGIFASGTVLVETLTGDINIEKDISTTNTTATAVTVIAGKSSPVGSIAGGDIKLIGSPNITMGTGGLVRLFSGYESNSPGLNALVGNLINVRNNLISSSTMTPGLVNGNKYAIYRLGKGLGDLTIVSSGGDPEGSTWTFDNGVISTQSLNAKLLNTTLQSKFISGDVTIEAQKVTFNANVTNTTNKAFKILAKTHIIDTSTSVVTTISTQGGDVLFATNVDDLTDSDSSVNGYVRFINGINITTNGGDIVMGGGNNGGTGYATGGSESDKHTGIRMDGAIVLNSGGGHIQLKGKSYDINTSSTSFGVGFWNTSGVSTILSGTGKVTIDGFSNSSGGNEMAGIFFSGAVSVTSSDTTENAIQLIGKATKNSGQAWGLEANGPLSLIAAGEGGGIKILTSQQRTGDNFDAVFRGTTNILAKSGPIKMLGGQDGGIAGGRFYTEAGTSFFIGSKAGSEVTTSSSDIVIQYDSYYFNTYPFVATSGKVNLQPASNNFAISIYSYWFNWNQNSQIMSGFTIGKPGNTADIAIETHPITVAGPIGIYGGYVVVNSILTSTTNGDIFIKGKSNINYSIGIFGNITKTLGTGTLTLQGDGGVYNDGVIKATGSAKLNIVLWSDFDNDNFGGVRQYDTINTNGGHVWMGGSNSNGGSTIWKGLLVGNGPSVGAGGSNGFALDFFGDVTTNGGELFVWAGNGNDGWHGIVTDANGCNVNTGSGDVTFIADRIWGSSGAAIILNTTGKFTFVPDGSSIPNPPLTWSHNGATNINLSNQFEFLNINNFSSLGGLQIGYYDGMAGIIHNNTSNVTISSPINIAGPISIYGGALAINAALASTNSAINLHAAGAVTQTTALSATSLG
ncbi:MAG: beta strand repeat-containing protein, partial [Bacteroidota bacterium]